LANRRLERTTPPLRRTEGRCYTAKSSQIPREKTKTQPLCALWPTGDNSRCFNAVYLSQIAKDGPNLLLFPPMNGPVFSISPSGEGKIHKLRSRAITDCTRSKRQKIRGLWNSCMCTQQPGGEMSTYAFDRETGAPLREYLLPPDLGWGLACTDGDEFTFVTANQKTNTPKTSRACASGEALERGNSRLPELSQESASPRVRRGRV